MESVENLLTKVAKKKKKSEFFKLEFKKFHTNFQNLNIEEW